MRVEFRIEAENRPPHHIADATIVFEREDGPAAGLVIGHWALWARRDGRPGISITAPATRRMLEEGSVRSFPISRSLKPSPVALDIRQRILAELWNQHPELVLKFGDLAMNEPVLDVSAPVAV